jgi:uncharacterized protein (TIGR00369 family)
LPPARAARWSKFGRWDRPYFPSFVGVVLAEVRIGYARLRLPYRPELEQPSGVLHGGAIATLIDTVVVPAIGSGYDEPRFMATLTMHITYLGSIRDDDAVAEGWVVRRGSSVVFCDAIVRAARGTEPAATGRLAYRVGEPR